MKKILLSLTSAVFLAACSGQETTGTADPEESSAPPEFETDGMTLEQLETTVQPGTDLDTYGMEIQALVQQGRINIQEKVQLSDDGSSHADIIAAKDGFLAVVNDGNQVTDTERFDTADAARTILTKNTKLFLPALSLAEIVRKVREGLKTITKQQG